MSLATTGPDDVLGGDPVPWALDQLQAAIGDGDLALELARAAGPPEWYRLTVSEGGARATVEAADPRGLGYAVTELAERIEAAGALDATEETHVPAAPVRSICRSFSSVDHDLAWFRDRAFWAPYLDHLARQRFNRFHLALGMQFNYHAGAVGLPSYTDNYLCFAYPFLLDVPGFEVRAQGVSDDERDRNLASLAFIARESRRRGMSFQLGLWNHAYDYGPGAEHRYPILGIGPETHAPYCAAAVARLLEAVPDIDGLTFRVHYEGGIPDEGHEVFWDQVFQAVSDVGRPLDVDLHAKGVDRAILDAVAKPNLRATLSAKYAAEHQGLPYHQASIRHLEQPMPVPEGLELMGTAEFSRRFTRYGYADFLREDREIDLLFRVWPGTQRLLLSGDPALARGYGRCGTFAGALGVELCEPLFFKGRKGSGQSGDRDPYVDDALRLGLEDWRKYAYTYVLWGRLADDPDADPAIWRRHLRAAHGPAAGDVEAALAVLSRVLPLVTTAHVPSASNNAYWPEVYTDLPISPWFHVHPYAWDTPNPTRWASASPLDPALFATVDEYVDATLAGPLDGRYTPLEVAAWLERLVEAGEAATERATARIEPGDPQGRRVLVDLRVLARLGRFFAGKFRAAVEYGFYERTGDPDLLVAAIRLLEGAHAAFAEIPGVVDGVYQRDLAFGEWPTERGHWADRLGAMADDLRALRIEHERVRGAVTGGGREIERRSDRWRLDGARLEAPDAFRRGDPMEVRLSPGQTIAGAVLHYRRVDQSAPWQRVEMEPVGEAFVGRVPEGYTDTAFPLMCFAEVRRPDDHPILVPGLDEDLANQPYLVVPSTRSCS